MAFSRQNLGLIFFCILIISLIVGTAITNIIVVSICFCYLYFRYKEKNFRELNLSWVKFYLIFWIYLIIISFFSSDFENSLRNSLSQIRFLILVLFIYSFFSPEKLKFLIYFIAGTIFLVGLDNNLQFFTGIDLFGYKAEGYVYDKRIFNLQETDKYYIGRLSGPFGSELITGAFISKLSFPVFFLFSQIFKNTNQINKVLIVLFFLLIIESVIISGERSSTIIVFAGLILSIYFSFGFKNTLKILLPLFLIIIIGINSNNFLKLRVKDSYSIIKNIPQSSYGILYNSSLQIWKKNIFTGVGLKNFRVECKNIPKPKNNPNNFSVCSTHPHNVLLEILSELGLFGLLFFIIFLKSFISNYSKYYKKKKNINLKYISLGSLFMIIISLIPFYPSGSLFTSWNATLLWINFGIASLITKDH